MDKLLTAGSASKWEGFRATKRYDLLAALPLLIWCAFAVGVQSPLLFRRLVDLCLGTIALKDFLQFVAILGSVAFNLTAIHFLFVRKKAVAKSKGALTRIIALVAAFMGNSMLLLPAAHLTLGMQAVSNLLVFGGSGAALFVLSRLGRSFSILPEARELNISGPYAVVRHPLYAAETIVSMGQMLQFQQPWALMIMMAGFVLMYLRAVCEERVLSGEYPQYAAYSARTPRFFPGLF